MPLDFNNVFNTLKTGVVNLAETTLSNFVAAASQDGLAFLDALKTQLEGWVQQVATGALSASDLEFLVLAQKDLLAMTALKQAGLAEIAVDQFKNDVINLVTSTLTSLIP
jgi:hypothetical protein